jgi:hypothetical protein
LSTSGAIFIPLKFQHLELSNASVRFRKHKLDLLTQWHLQSLMLKNIFFVLVFERKYLIELKEQTIRKNNQLQK